MQEGGVSTAAVDTPSPFTLDKHVGKINFCGKKFFTTVAHVSSGVLSVVSSRLWVVYLCLRVCQACSANKRSCAPCDSAVFGDITACTISVETFGGLCLLHTFGWVYPIEMMLKVRVNIHNVMHLYLFCTCWTKRWFQMPNIWRHEWIYPAGSAALCRLCPQLYCLCLPDLHLATAHCTCRCLHSVVEQQNQAFSIQKEKNCASCEEQR